MESQYTSSFDTWLFWPCILEQPRVEFDTALFHITGPEQHRVKILFDCLELYVTNCDPIETKLTTNGVSME